MTNRSLILEGVEVRRMHDLLQEASGRLEELGRVFDPVLASRVDHAQTSLLRARQILESMVEQQRTDGVVLREDEGRAAVRDAGSADASLRPAAVQAKA